VALNAPASPPCALHNSDWGVHKQQQKNNTKNKEGNNKTVNNGIDLAWHN